MSKKSYKQLQNRLYQEIKRRMIAEMLSNRAVTVCKTTVDIETVKIAHTMSFLDYEQGADYAKELLARKIGESLYQSGRIKYSVIREPFLDLDVDCIRMEASLDVVKDKRVLP